MSHIFISYSRKDIDFAGQIVQALADNNLDAWIDWKSIPKGEDFEQEIYRGIEGADAFLFLISPDSVASQMCNKEISHAVKNGKRILPIVIRDDDPKNIHPEISKRNWIFCREGEEVFSKTIEEIRNTIHTDYDWAQAHRRLQVKALEWVKNNKEISFLLRGKDLEDAEFQLAKNTSKEPHPTDLQRDYVFKSRLATDRQRRITTSISIVGVITLAALAVFGFLQAGLATANEKKAASNASTAQANANIASTAQTNAEEQANIALARQLAAQAQSIVATNNSKQMIADLLATKSMELFPSNEATQVLLNNNLAARSIARMSYASYAYFASFSPDGKYVVSSGCDVKVNIMSECSQSSARVWEVATGNEIARMTHRNIAYLIAFSPDGKYVASSGCDIETDNSQNSLCTQGSARVWEATNGNEIFRMTYSDLVYSVAFSPDGKYIAAGTCNTKNNSNFICTQGAVHVWEVSKGSEIALIFHDAPVTSFIFSPDGKYIAIGGGKTARVWELSTSREVSQIKHKDSITTVAFSPDSHSVVSGSVDGAIVMWDIAMNQEVISIIQVNGNSSSGLTKASSIFHVAFSPNSKYILTSAIDGTARVWEVATGKEIARMTHDGYVGSIAFSPDGNFAVSGGTDNTARVWETLTGKEIARMTHDDWVRTVAFSPDGKFIVSSGDNTIRVWEAFTGNEVFPQIGDFVTALSFSPNGKYVASGNWDTTVRMWDIKKGREIYRMTASVPVQSVVFSPSGKYIASKSLDTHTHIWEAETGKEVAVVTHKDDDPTYEFAFSPDENLLVTIGCDTRDNTSFSCVKGSARIWEIITGKEIARLIHDGNVISVAFSSDGKHIVLGSVDGSACTWEVMTGKEIACMTHDKNVLTIAFSPDGKYVVSGGDHTARVWELLSGKEVARMTHDENVLSVAFSPDGIYVVSGGDNTVRIWEASTGREVARMIHDDLVNSVTFNRDGKYVASGSDDNTVRIWNVSTGEEVARMTHDAGVTSVTFSPDDKYLVSISRDGTAHAWLWHSKDLIANACAFLPRNLTRKEWKQYVNDALPYQAVCPNLPIEPTSTP